MTSIVFKFGLLTVTLYQTLLRGLELPKSVEQPRYNMFALMPKCQHIPRAILDDSECLFVIRTRIMNVQTF